MHFMSATVLESGVLPSSQDMDKKNIWTQESRNVNVDYWGGEGWGRGGIKSLAGPRRPEVEQDEYVTGRQAVHPQLIQRLLRGRSAAPLPLPTSTSTSHPAY